jgi:hypothetical protein
MAVGPCPPSTPACTSGNGEASYVVAQNLTSNAFRAIDGAPLGTVWSPTGGTLTTQKGHFPVVLRHGAETGRVVVAGQFLSLGEGIVRVERSDDGGATWAVATPAEFLADRNGDIIHRLDGSPALAIPNLGFRVRGLPSVATDPRDTRVVYVAFPARRQDPMTLQVDTRSDIYIAVSFDGGATFPNDFTYRITDTQLQLPGESDPSLESMPSIAVDHTGGIILLFARTDDPASTDPATASLRVARWSGLNVLHNNPGFLYELASFPVGTGYQPVVGAAGNDYHMVATSNCWFWTGYSRPLNGVPHIFVRRFEHSLTCSRADFDGNNVVDSADLAGFMAAYSIGAPEADINEDEQITTLDPIDFITEYAAAGGTP